MRIVHVTDCYMPRLGGIELQVHDLAARQASAGHEVTVFTSTAGATRHCDSAVEVRTAARPRHPAEKIMYRSTHRGIRDLTGELERYDLVHAHASSFSPLAFLAAHHASGRGVPTVATVHSLWAKATPLFRAAHGLTGWGDWQVVWSAVSNAAAASIRSILKGRAPVTILPNGIDPEDWELAAEWGSGSRAVPVGSGLPASDLPSVLRVAAVSRLARRKRIFQLVEILHAAHDRLPPEVRLEVNILGEGPQRKDIERYLRRHGMDGWVHLLGRRSRADIRQVFARSDLFLAPASLESFGIAALEGRCAGLPLVARAGTGVQDFVAHGVEGWLVGSDSAMVDTVVSLACRPEVLTRVAEHNRTVPARISWKLVLDECEDLYERAADLHGRRWRRAGTARTPALRGATPPGPAPGR